MSSKSCKGTNSNFHACLTRTRIKFERMTRLANDHTHSTSCEHTHISHFTGWHVSSMNIRTAKFMTPCTFRRHQVVVPLQLKPISTDPQACLARLAGWVNQDAGGCAPAVEANFSGPSGTLQFSNQPPRPKPTPHPRHPAYVFASQSTRKA